MSPPGDFQIGNPLPQTELFNRVRDPYLCGLSMVTDTGSQLHRRAEKVRVFFHRFACTEADANVQRLLRMGLVVIVK